MGEHLGFRSTTASIGALYFALPLLFVLAHRREVARALEVATTWSSGLSCGFVREQRRSREPAADIESRLGADAQAEQKAPPSPQSPYSPPPPPEAHTVRRGSESDGTVPRSASASSIASSSVG